MGLVTVVLLDTCALLWWTLDPDGLSEKAREVCGKIMSEGAFVSSISIWEIGIKQQKGVLELGDSLRGYVDRLNSLGSLEVIPVNEHILVQNITLDWHHRDPADRTIVATAMLRELPILTKDQIIVNFYDNTIW